MREALLPALGRTKRILAAEQRQSSLGGRRQTKYRLLTMHSAVDMDMAPAQRWACVMIPSQQPFPHTPQRIVLNNETAAGQRRGGARVRGASRCLSPRSASGNLRNGPEVAVWELRMEALAVREEGSSRANLLRTQCLAIMRVEEGMRPAPGRREEGMVEDGG